MISYRGIRWSALLGLAALFAVTLRADELLVCGGDEVFAIEVSHPTQGAFKKTWSWHAKDCEELPENLRKAFATTDDCKPIEGGRKVLISSSSGGCALVEKPSGHVLWSARVPNAHSLEALPGDRIVVASSTAKDGDRLVLFDLAHGGEPLWTTPLLAAHGVVWDISRYCLWALGHEELRRYELKDWKNDKPSLSMTASQRLPDEDGHELQPVPQSNKLVITTHSHVFLFDRDKAAFEPHPDLSDTVNVKCVTVHPVTGRTAYVQAAPDGSAWWSDSVKFLSPAETLPLNSGKIYKVRWVPPAGL
jgi:hypothetical protein